MFSEGVMWRLVLVVSLLCCSSEASVSCRDENGAEVERCKDQPPKINGKEESVPQPRGLSEVAAVDVQKRVLNGRDCTRNEGTHYVVLVPPGSGFDDRFCGGNLISDEWILTARHCDDPEFDVILGHHPSLAGQRMQIRGNNNKHYFPDNNVPPRDRHDIMLVQLPRATTYRPITLPSLQCASPAPPFNNPYTIMGWSYTEVDPNTGIKNLTLAVKLQCGKVKLHPDHTGRHQSIYNTVNGTRIPFYINHHLLYSYEEVPCKNCPSPWKKIVSCFKPCQPCPNCSNGVHCTRCPNSKRCEACSGDSGGSLVKKVGNVDVLVGVTVAGPDEPSGLTYYMDVCAYRDWINTVTGF